MAYLTDILRIPAHLIQVVDFTRSLAFVNVHVSALSGRMTERRSRTAPYRSRIRSGKIVALRRLHQGSPNPFPLRENAGSRGYRFGHLLQSVR